MTQALWSGRFEGKMGKDVLDFTSSLDADSRLAFYDVLGSVAHVKMLKACGIIPPGDADTIEKGLKTILDSITKGEFRFDHSKEDVHSCIEFALTDLIGPTGGKLHTARSRNDQVATDFRMYLRDSVLLAVDAIGKLIETLIATAEKERNTILPGFTHTQHAQPITLAQHLLAHVFRLSRDADRFMDAFVRMNRCPLGSAALAGTTFPIDRRMTSDALGFAEPTENSLDSVSDRDFVLEFAFCCAQTQLHLSSVCEELILWSSQEFGFLELDDGYTTGSSIMPQKKNPDVAELIRGRTGKTIGNLTALMVTVKALPLSYNRDLQEDKAGAMESADIVLSSLSMVSKMIETAEFRRDRMSAAASDGQINATDLADYLVTKGMPFREAHAAVGAAVRQSIETGVPLESMDLAELRQFSGLIEEDVFSVLPIEKCVERRNSQGGTSSDTVGKQLSEARRRLKLRTEAAEREKQHIDDCWNSLRSRTNPNTQCRFRTVNADERIGAVAALSAGILWGFLGVFVRYLEDEGFSVVQMTCFRYIVVAVIVLFFILARDRRMLIVDRRDLVLLLIMGIFGTLLNSVCYFGSMELISLSMSTVLQYLSPFMVVALSVPIFGERLTSVKIAALIIAFAGCVLCTGLISDPGSMNITGIALGAACGIFYSLYTVGSKKETLRGRSTPTILLYTSVFCFVGLLPFADVSGAISVITPSSGLAILGLGVLMTLAPFGLYNIALSRMEAGKAAIITFIEPVAATMVGFAIFSESVTAEAIVGMVMILCSLILLEKRPTD